MQKESENRMAKRKKEPLGELEKEKGIRLNKYLSDAGVCSRREGDRYIEAGKVKIDGETVTVGTRVYPGQIVTLDGKEVIREEEFILLAFYKPKGIVCTTTTMEPDNIIDYIQYEKRIYPIGRLDKDSEGLILLTNNGEVVNKILKAKNYHEKEYIVKVNKPITNEFIKRMNEGVPILDTVTRPCKINVISKDSFNIILTQGLNRQIRRMCEYLGYRVIFLKRTRIMNIRLGKLKVGSYRKVTDKELEGLGLVFNDLK